VDVELDPLFQTAVIPAFKLRYYPEDREGNRLQPIELSFVRSFIDGRPVYVGVPLDKRGFARSRGAILVWSDSMMIGSRALSYVLGGGWSKNNATETKHTARAAKRRLFAAFWQTLISHSRHQLKDAEFALGNTLSAFLHVKTRVTPGVLTEEDIQDLTDLACPQWVLDALKFSQYRPVINPQLVAARFVKNPPTAGDWETPADIEALTNCLTIGVVNYLRRHRVTFGAPRGSTAISG